MPVRKTGFGLGLIPYFLSEDGEIAVRNKCVLILDVFDNERV